MENVRKFSGQTENEIWEQISQDMAREDDILEYTAIIEQQGQAILFDIDIDLGGGFESGFETTRFTATVPEQTTLHFHLYPQDWVNEIGKLFGMEDVALGYPELDAAYIVKTNQPETLKQIFTESEIQQLLLKYPKAHLKLAPNEDEGETSLRLSVYFYEAVTNPTDLQQVYHLLIIFLDKIASANSGSSI